MKLKKQKQLRMSRGPAHEEWRPSWLWKIGRAYAVLPAGHLVVSATGRELANQVVRLFPDLKILLTTGMEPDKAADVDSDLEFRLLAKPYSASELAQSVRAAIDD